MGCGAGGATAGWTTGAGLTSAGAVFSVCGWGLGSTGAALIGANSIFLDSGATLERARLQLMRGLGRRRLRSGFDALGVVAGSPGAPLSGPAFNSCFGSTADFSSGLPSTGAAFKSGFAALGVVAGSVGLTAAGWFGVGNLAPVAAPGSGFAAFSGWFAAEGWSARRRGAPGSGFSAFCGWFEARRRDGFQVCRGSGFSAFCGCVGVTAGSGLAAFRGWFVGAAGAPGGGFGAFWS